MEIVDLHVHSTASDGTMTPSDLVDYALSKNLKAFALTDHDSVDGIEEALKKAEELRLIGQQIEVIPGIELSTDYYGKDVHIVGLFIDYKSKYLKERINNFRINRTKRNREMCLKCTEHGMPISLEELEETFKGAVLTRAHYAKYMQMKGYVKSVKEAFDRFLGDRKPCFVSRKKMSPARAIEIIRRSGGFPVLAHPVLYGFSNSVLDGLVAHLKDVGLLGIEAIYSTYTQSDERSMRDIAKKYSLCISGGSDFHGTNKTDIDLATGKGKLFIPDEVLENIRSKYFEIKKTENSFYLPKILFTDLDGTLLDDNKKISGYTYDVFKEWTEKGNYIALCSGRDINSVDAVYKELGFDSLNNFYLIGYNGGQIVNAKSGMTIYSSGIRIEAVEYIEKLALQMDVHLQTYTDTHIVTHEPDEEIEYYGKVIKTPVKYSSRLSLELSKEPCKCLAIELHDKAKLEAFRVKMLEYAKVNGLSLMYSSDYYLEIIPSDSGKGASVRKLIELMDVKGIISVGAGDQQNDVSMLEVCDIAIAMKNATDELKNKANLVTEFDNNESGLAKELAKL